MANGNSNALYSPYGAYELKASYQRNFLIGTLATLSFVLLILFSFWLAKVIQGGPDEIFSAATVIKTVAELGPPPTVAKTPPQVKLDQPKVVAPKIGIPQPVPDDEVMDDDVVLATRDELAEIVAPDISANQGDGDIIVDIADDDYLPAPGEFRPVEIFPELIHREEPEYPKMAKLAGMEGKVAVSVLVTPSGDVRECIVAKTSGLPALDEAAQEAGMKCKFKPGIQNGQPVFCWVSFNYLFTLIAE
ncbi:MAG: TonB family protein [candidate division Zixibacteria bacterium]